MILDDFKKEEYIKDLEVYADYVKNGAMFDANRPKSEPKEQPTSEPKTLAEIFAEQNKLIWIPSSF